MFGKTGVFCEGLMLGIVAEDTLYFRVDGHNRAEFAEAASFPPLNYKKKGETVDLSFWRAPERLFDEPDELVTWARIALAAARRVAAKRERTAPKARSGKVASGFPSDRAPSKESRAGVGDPALPSDRSRSKRKAKPRL